MPLLEVIRVWDGGQANQELERLNTPDVDKGNIESISKKTVYKCKFRDLMIMLIGKDPTIH